MDTWAVAVREVKKLQRDEIARHQLCFTPPTDEEELLTFWYGRLYNRLNMPRGWSVRERRIFGLLFDLAMAQREEAALLATDRAAQDSELGAL